MKNATTKKWQRAITAEEKLKTEKVNEEKFTLDIPIGSDFPVRDLEVEIASATVCGLFATCAQHRPTAQ